MGREVRMVPPDWEHPKNKDAEYIPLLGRSFKEDLASWEYQHQLWKEGKVSIYHHDGGYLAVPKEDVPVTSETFEEWYGSQPLEEHYMPYWPAEQRTHFQMYEDTSEGTPISPVMETPELLARWLADNNASAFADMTATYDQWLAVIHRGFAVSAVIGPDGLRSGVEASPANMEA